MESAEYHYYIFPEISTWKHQTGKVCHGFTHRIENPDLALDLDSLYDTGHLCPLCAFYVGLWYDRGKNSSILEHFKIHVKATHPKSPDSPYWIEKIDLGNQESQSLQSPQSPKELMIEKIQEQYQTMVKKRAYKEADFAALTQTQQILERLHQRIDHYALKGSAIRIFHEVIS